MTSTKPNLVVVWSYLDWGGAQIYLLAIIKRAIDEWNVTVAMPQASSPEIVRYVRNTSARIEFLDHQLDTGDASTLSRKIARQRSRIKSEIEIYKFLRRFSSPDTVCHIEISPWQSWIFLTLLAARGLNTFITLHNPPGTNSSMRRSIWHLRMKFVTSLRRVHLFASNEFTKSSIRPLVSKERWKEIPVTYTAIDPEQIDQALSLPNPRDKFRKQFGIAEKAVVLLTVGQFIDRKGRWMLLEAAKKLAKRSQDIVFLWLAPSEPAAEDQHRIDSYELGDSFRVIRSDAVGQTRGEILSFFRIADIFVLPSFVEGLPIALLEAMALGLPSISTSVYAIPEAISDGQTGLLVEAGNVAELADSIQRLKCDPSLRSSLAIAGRELVIKTFDERRTADLAIGEYRRSLDG